MVFTAITDSEIQTGKPVSSTTQTKVQDNFDNHETRISALEGGATAVYAPIILSCYGKYASEWVMDNIVRTTLNFNLTITGVRLLINKAGSAGTTEVALKFKRGGGSWTSICTTNPSVAYSSGDNYLSTNAVLNPSNVDLQAGDILRADLISAQTNGYTFQLRIDFNKT